MDPDAPAADGGEAQGPRPRQHGHAGVFLNGGGEGTLYLRTRRVLVVDDARHRVRPLSGKVERSVLVPVEGDRQLLYE